MTDNPYASPYPEHKPIPTKGRLKIILLQVAVAVAVITVLIAMLLPNVHRASEPARRTQCKNNLKQIGMALHQYHDTFGTFPPVYTVDADGKRLHSWRTLILPYLDQIELYKQIDLSKPWDDQVNAEFVKTDLYVYACSTIPRPFTKTSYMAIAGTGTCFPGAASRSISEIKDGTSNTVMIVEVDAEKSVPWMSPADLDDQYLVNVDAKSKFSHAGGLYTLFADGSVRFLSYKIGQAFRLSMVTADAGDTFCDDPY
jgi:prepilin-type processing-associated H-X9-DG protein